MQIFFFCFCCCFCFFNRISLSSLLDFFFSEETVNETPWLFGERGSKHRRTIKQIDCKTVGFFSRKISKEIGKAWHKSLICARARVYIFSVSPPVSLSVFSLVPDLLFDCSRVLEYAKIQTVSQSIKQTKGERVFFVMNF